MLAADVGERPVTTIEGVAGERGSFSPVQQALIDSGAIQCGFCTPGFVDRAHRAVRSATRIRAATRSATALSGNLCRCSGYVKIVEAAMALAERSDG